MILDLLSASNWIINIALPATALSYQPQDKAKETIYSVTGFSGGMGYAFSDIVIVAGDYSFNYSLGSKNTFLYGTELFLKSYLVGGLAMARNSETLRAYVAPRYSLFFTLLSEQKSFDFQTARSKTVTISSKRETPSYKNTGSFFALGAAVGFESVIFSDSFRFGADFGATQSLTVTTALKLTEMRARLLFSYQL